MKLNGNTVLVDFLGLEKYSHRQYLYISYFQITVRTKTGHRVYHVKDDTYVRLCKAIVYREKPDVIARLVL